MSGFAAGQALVAPITGEVNRLISLNLSSLEDDSQLPGRACYYSFGAQLWTWYVKRSKPGISVQGLRVPASLEDGSSDIVGGSRAKIHRQEGLGKGRPRFMRQIAATAFS
jgi:hypothetical protein